MPKCDFNKVANHGYSAVNLLYISRAPFLMNTSGGLLLQLRNQIFSRNSSFFLFLSRLEGTKSRLKTFYFHSIMVGRVWSSYQLKIFRSFPYIIKFVLGD